MRLHSMTWNLKSNKIDCSLDDYHPLILHVVGYILMYCTVSERKGDKLTSSPEYLSTEPTLTTFTTCKLINIYYD